MEKKIMKPTTSTCLALALALALSGCAPVQVLPIKGKGAMVDIQLSTESTGSIMKQWGVVAYQDERCEKEEKGVVLAKGASPAPITLPTDRKVTLTFGYSEVRLGVNAGCVYSLTFAPVENQHYTARFAIIGNSTSCKATISDAAGQIVKVTTPEQFCRSGSVALALPNGQGSISVPPSVQVYSR